MVMARYEYLTKDRAAELLRQGASLQQWLGARESDGFRFLRWIEIDPTGDTWAVFEKDSLDSGRTGDRDLTSFHNTIDPDAPEGVRYSCDTIAAVFAKCTDLGCSLDRFVRFCEIQHVYDEFIAANGHADRGADQYFSKP